jgi:hypothetical protein
MKRGWSWREIRKWREHYRRQRAASRLRYSGLLLHLARESVAPFMHAPSARDVAARGNYRAAATSGNVIE